MILVFFVTLAFLVWMIGRELDRRTQVLEARIACGGCGTELKTDWLLCPACGSLALRSCEGCGRVHAREDDFCPWCGREAVERAA
ncbi:MAG: hypothetical protein Tsb0017_02450 [Geothermobacteraceae bacterium]